jgi:transposase
MIYHKFVALCGESKCGVNADDFHLFLLDLCPHLPESAVILLNNVPIHTVETVGHTFNLLHADGFKVLFLPPYLLFLNPIKYAFSKIKGKVHSTTFHNQPELLKATEAAIRTITAKDSCHWFTHMVRYYQQCALSLPFTGKLLDPALVALVPAPMPIQHHQWEAMVSVEAAPAVPFISTT